MSTAGATKRSALARALQARHRLAPPRIGRVGRQPLGAGEHPHAAALYGGERGQRLVGGRRPRGHALGRQRAVRIPERRGHSRRRLQRLVARDDVRVDARLAQAHRGGEADDAGADDDRLHAPGPRARRAGARAAGRVPASRSRTRCLGRSGPPGAPRSTAGSRPWRAQTSRANSRRESDVGARDVQRAGGGWVGGIEPELRQLEHRGREVADLDRAADLVGEEGHVARAVGDLERHALLRRRLRAAVDERRAHDQRVGRAQSLGLELRGAVRA